MLHCQQAMGSINRVVSDDESCDGDSDASFHTAPDVQLSSVVSGALIPSSPKGFFSLPGGK